RGFCSERRWPIGNLNLPRPLLTEKAFPEDEVVTVMTVPATDTNRVDTAIIYERRLGSRSQFELTVPFRFVKSLDTWNRGLGDVAVGVKHAFIASARRGSMLSGGAELTFPTGN